MYQGFRKKDAFVKQRNGWALMPQAPSSIPILQLETNPSHHSSASGSSHCYYKLDARSQAQHMMYF